MAVSTTVDTWLAMEEGNFDHLTPFVMIRLEDGILRSIAKKMGDDLKTKKSTSVELPWGTYSAEVKESGEGTNITPTFEPSKRFIKLINEDSENLNYRQDSFDPDYVKLLIEYVAEGKYDSENSDTPPKTKGMRIDDTEVDYFLNSYMQMLATLAREHRRPGKIYPLEIDGVFPHGRFDFIYKDDNTEVKFTPHKVFKQYLKNDEAATDQLKNGEYTENSQQLVPLPLVLKHKKGSPYEKFYLKGLKRRVG